jgi:hypothetical protein
LKFNPSINEWAWIKGPEIKNASGIYGVQNVPSPTNNPGTRGFGVATWVDTSGNLWLFGGWGLDIIGHYGSLNDLWMYNILTNEWTWVAGSDSINSNGSYGIITVSNPTNNPPPR